MGEIEGLDTDEPLPERLQRHAFDRLIMLSDGVFAIAVTLAAIEVRPEAGWTDLASLWRALRLPVFAYLVSFAVAATYWASHRDTFARLGKADAIVTLITLGLLFSVALLPATTRLLYAGGRTPAFQLYCLSVALTGAWQALLWVYASLRKGVMRPGVGLGFRIGRIAMSLFVPGFFLTLATTADRGFTTLQINLMLALVGLVFLARRVALPWLERRLP